MTDAHITDLRLADPRLADIVDEFSFLDDWEERYRHVIDLGRALDPLADDERVDAAKVRGCASQVWLLSDVRDGVIHFRSCCGSIQADPRRRFWALMPAPPLELWVWPMRSARSDQTG
jgi:hypothetical protein